MGIWILRRRSRSGSGTGFNEIEDKRAECIRSIADLIAEFHEAYNLRNPRSVTFAIYATRHLKRLLGRQLAVDLSPAMVKDYQTARLKEKAAAKTINEEVGFLLRILGERGEFIRAKLRRERALKLKSAGVRVARAFTALEKEKLLTAAKARRSPSIYPALMLALHAGMRDAEIRNLTLGESGSPARHRHRGRGQDGGGRGQNHSP